MTHWPGLCPAKTRPHSLKRALADPSMPERLRQPSGWPERLQREWGADEGSAASEAHRDRVVTEIRKARQVLDDFRPDFVVVWGDDQYENFQEDLVPPFAVLAYDQFEAKPWAHFREANYWSEPEDATFRLPGHRAGGKLLASGLLKQGFDVAYAYRPLHQDPEMADALPQPIPQSSSSAVLRPPYDGACRWGLGRLAEVFLERRV